MNRKVPLLIILILLLIIAGCSKESLMDTGSLSGSVTLFGQTDHSKITVLLKEKELTANSSATGQYSFINLTSGNYTLIFSKTGYTTATKKVQIINGHATKVPPFIMYPVSQPIANPIKGLITGHNTYFDFDSGQCTNDTDIADARLDAFYVYNNHYSIKLDQINASFFGVEYNTQKLPTFAKFAEITTTDYNFFSTSYDLHVGDVFLVKTNQNKYAKLLIYELVTEYRKATAPTAKFVYLYENLIDITVPQLIQVKLITDDGTEHTAMINGGTITFNVTTRPNKIQLVFNEFVKSNDQFYQLDANFAFKYQPELSTIPYYDVLSANLYNRDYGIIKTGTYTINTEQFAYYFEDLSGNKITTMPFSTIIINYTK